MSAIASKLFQPIRVGTVQLAHRVVMSPMTRNRNTADHVPTDLVLEYYTQRAAKPGTLIITEATIIADKASGQEFVPGIWSDKQVEEWKKIVDAVHAKGSFIYMQLWALGRTAYPSTIEGKGFDYVSASAIGLSDRDKVPRALTTEEVKEYVQLYGTAAHNAVNRAGFDGVEIHGANGYLIDVFLQDKTNNRTDEYGGSVENRIRFADEVVDSVVKAVGQERAAIRLSPWNVWQEMGMKDPVPTFKTLVERIHSKHPDLAYIHVVEPDAYGEGSVAEGVVRSNDFVDEIRLPKPVIHAQGYERATALKAAEKEGVLVGFARAFIGNPDLVVKLEKDTPLIQPDYTKLFTQGADGYVDYPSAEAIAVGA
ncbi:NADH:flavin oxidoreductase/NADH oxidase [Peniophora sp. CONT]|nr:NADH:flavin oxidoreductase/NADH oxidase [Peniophora sp. CONT]